MNIKERLNHLNKKRENSKFNYLKIYSYAILLALSLKNIHLCDSMKTFNNPIEINKNDNIEVDHIMLAMQEPSLEYKVKYIIETNNLTIDYFNTIAAIVSAKNQTKTYEEAYRIINILYNRTQDEKWIQSVNSNLEQGTGSNLYYQSIFLDQFEIYANGIYQQYLNNNLKTSPTYQACVDFLYTKNTLYTDLDFQEDTIEEMVPTLEQKIRERIETYNSEELEMIKLALNIPTKNIDFLENDISLKEKEEDILKRYSLTEEQFNILASIILAEAKPYDIEDEEHYIDSYIDAYASTNIIYNRIHSIRWVTYIDSLMGEEKGVNLYYQSICKGQFSVYASGDYKKYLNMDKTELPGYQAIIDMLYTENIMHHQLKFVASFYFDNKSDKEKQQKERIQFVPNGNWYGEKLLEQDIFIIDEQKILQK